MMNIKSNGKYRGKCFGGVPGIVCVLLFCLLSFSVPCQASPPANYFEVWGDEFAGSSLNTGNWVYWLYPGNYKNATLSQSAVSESGNHAVITTYTSGSTDYTAMLASQGKFHFCYGYVEANIQWSDNTGMWSAFWLQSPLMGSYIGNPALAGAEIDICEHRLQDGSANNINNDVQSNIHWNGYGSSETSAGSGNYSDSAGDLGSGFHKYGLLWTSSGYTFYVNDGQQVYSTSSGLSAHTEFIILSSIVDDTDTTWAGTIPSGGYGSLSSSSTKLAVDYVRYYAPNNSIFWTGSDSQYWFDPTNWISYTTAPAGGNDVIFSMLSTGNLNTTLDQNLTVNSLSIWETGSPVTISSNTLTINNTVDMNSAYNDVTVNSAVVLGNANYWSIGPGRTFKVVGPLSGGHSLHCESLGTVALYNTNSYTLGTFVDAGTLSILNGGALGPTNVGTTVASGATLQIYSSLTCNQPLTLNGTAPALRVSGGANAVWTGPITLSNAVTIQLDGGTSLAISNNITGGHSLYLAGDGGSQGLMAGSISTTGGFAVGKSGAGTWTLAGTNTFTGALDVDSDSTSANDGALVIVSSNSVGTASSIQILNNNSGSSTLQLNGSTGNFVVAQPIALNARNVTVPAIENLSGSNTLSGGIAINSGGAIYEVQSDAGTLNLAGPVSSAVSGARTFTLQGTGGILVSGVISNGTATTFGITAAGPGNLTFAAANSYNGPTTISGGKLALAASGSISASTNIFVAGGATFDVSQTGGFALGNGQTLSGSGVVTGMVTCASGSMVSPGGGTTETTLSFSNSLALNNGTTWQLDLANTATEGGGVNDEILIAGNLSLSGTNTLSINPVVGTLASGRYVLARYGGALTGGATNFVVVFTGVPPQAALALDFSVAGQVGLVVSSFPGNLVWQGDGAANLWNSGGASNWLNGSALSAFSPGDSVTFDNTSTNFTVNLSGSLAPGLVTVNGSSNYVFTGSGKISGITGLVDNDPGTITILTTNNFTGATAINAGTVQVGNGTTAGSLGSGSVIDNGALIYYHTDTETNPGAISGTGTFTKLGSGTINLNGNNSFSGGTTLSQGTIAANVSGALGSGAVSIINSATQLVLAAGITLSNSVSVSPGASSGVFASGIIKGPAAGSATLAGPMNITTLTGNGGHFDGGNSSGGLVISGPITASAPVRHRANRVTFAGGGNYALFWSEGTTVLGATNGLATNAVADLGYSGAAGTLDLAGFSQTLNGVLKGSQTGTVANSSTNSDSMLTISGVTSNTAYAGTIQDSVSGGTHKVWLTVSGGTFTLSAANTFSGDTELTGGTLAISSSTALQDSPLNLAAGDAGVLSFTTLTSATIGGLKGARNLGLTNSSGAAVALTVGNGNTNIYIYSGSLTGGGSVTKASAGTLVLTGTNTFTGGLNTDTAQPSSGNDGMVDLASPGAVNGVSSIAIRNQNAAYSTLQLDGSAGVITMAKPVSLSGRNNFVAAVDNLDGNNIWSPASLTLGTGGSFYTFQCDANTLTMATAFPSLGAIGSSASASRILNFQGAGNIFVSAPIQNANPTNGVMALTMNGTGTLTLAATNTYTGPATNFSGTLLINGVTGTNTLQIFGGALGGGGVIGGPVSVQAGATISPGAILGVTSTLAISNSLNLSGTTLLALNPAGGTNDLIRGLTTVNYGGTLILTNLGGVYASNSTFKIFSAASYTGAFANISPAVPALGYAWNTNTLATDGTLRVVQTVNLTATNLSFTVNAGQMTLSWPADHIGWSLQAQTDSLASGLGTNWVDVPGANLTNMVTLPVNYNGSVFYRLTFP